MMRSWVLPLLIAIAPGSFAQEDCLPKKPDNEDHLVHQFTEFLPSNEAARLDRKLVDFARETGNQIAVVVVDTLCDAPYAAAHAILESWGIGQKGKDNGVVILVKPTGPPGSREIFITTGYGLEGVIPDATAKQIVENEIIPRFREGNYFNGLDRATDMLMALAKGEFNAKSYGKGKFPWHLLLLVIAIFALIAIGGARNARRYARTNSIDFWTAWFLMNQMNKKHRGGWGGFSAGRGWGGGGGGGFGGFGGGFGGGGGAGGRW